MPIKVVLYSEDPGIEPAHFLASIEAVRDFCHYHPRYLDGAYLDTENEVFMLHRDAFRRNKMDRLCQVIRQLVISSGRQYKLINGSRAYLIVRQCKLCWYEYRVQILEIGHR